MKRFALLIPVFALCAVLLTQTAAAQGYTQPPVTVSKDKVRGNDGKVYYAHAVMEKQTLFSISHAYGVSVDDICNANPELNLKRDGLKKGVVLKIPITANPQKTASDTGNGKAAKGDAGTAESRAGTKEGGSGAEENNAVKDDGSGQQTGEKTVHVVKWYEDIDDIARLYGVPVTDIMKANNLSSRKLRRRMKLIIPIAGSNGDTDAGANGGTDGKGGEGRAEEKTDSTAATGFFDLFGTKKNADVALLLPFDSKGNGSGINLDFYSGFLMGLRSAGKGNEDINLKVYDVAGGQLPPYSEIRDADLIIGPVSAKDLGRTAEMDSRSVPIVSPLDQKAENLVDGYPYFIQTPTPHDVQYRDLAEWIKTDMRYGDRITVISEKGSADETAAKINEIFNTKGLAFSRYSYNILEGRNAVQGLESICTETGCNRIVIASENEAFVNDAIRNLNQLAFKKYRLVLYSSSKIRAFDTIDVETFHTLNTHVSLSYYIDYDLPAVRQFLLEYRALFGTEPSQFAFQGHDIASFFTKTMEKYGSRWFERLGETGEVSELQSNFRFVKKNGGGYLNNAVRRIIYEPNYKIRLVNEP